MTAHHCIILRTGELHVTVTESYLGIVAKFRF